MPHGHHHTGQKNAKQSVAFSSVLASLGLTLMKGTVGIMTGSMGVLSEAAHSALDFGAAALTFFAVREGDKPADKKHPYGHAKVESVSALIETGLLFVTSAWIIYEAAQRLIVHSVEIDPAWYAFAVIGISIIVDFSRSRALNKVAKETKSQALEADALHFSSDILSSIVVLIGLGFVALGINVADSIAAIGVSIFVAHAGYKLGKRTIDVLVDTAPEGVVDSVIAEAKKVEGVVSVEKARVRPAGAVVFVDMSITVSRRLTQERVHSICNTIEHRIKKAVPEADVSIRTKPVSLDNETITEQVQLLASNHGLAAHDIEIQTIGGKKYVGFDLEVDSRLSIAKAHKQASHLEDALKEEMGGEIEVYSHIEPLSSKPAEGRPVTPEEEARILEAIGQVVTEVKLSKGFHGLRATRAGGRIFVSLHCSFEDDLPVEDVHDASSRIEHLIRERLADVKRVVVHPEPVSEK